MNTCSIPKKHRLRPQNLQFTCLRKHLIQPFINPQRTSKHTWGVIIKQRRLPFQIHQSSKYPLFITLINLRMMIVSCDINQKNIATYHSVTSPPPKRKQTYLNPLSKREQFRINFRSSHIRTNVWQYRSIGNWYCLHGNGNTLEERHLSRQQRNDIRNIFTFQHLKQK